ncbi:MAG TPA: glycosyltransferase family 1 protein [Patescibacteria group bacterium]|nr:glycosyltransferase family 1 protein [Patescibacteria group bacterium]
MSNKGAERRIGIDVTSALNQGAGIGRYTRELIKAVVFESAADKFTLISAKLPHTNQLKNPFMPLKPNVVFKELPFDERWMHRIWYRLKVPLSVQNFTGRLDLFHSPDFVLPPINKKTPTLLTIHDLSFIRYPETFTPELVAYLNQIVPWSINRATHILADSKTTKDDLVTQWNVDPVKVSVLYSGVGGNFEPITNPRSIKKVRKKYDLGDKPYLISVGTVQPRKNYRMLIRAFRPVAENFPNDLIIVGGKGWMHDQILGEVEAQGLHGRVKFLGYVDDSDLPALYSAATILASPSLYEGFGLPILEAMACGVPVIASNVSSLPEVVGDAGVLLPTEDTDAWSQAMMNLIEDMSQRTKLVGAGFLRARQFTWSKSAKELMSIYDQLLAG